MTYPTFQIPSLNPQNITIATPVGLQSATRDPTAQDNIYIPGTEWQNTLTGTFFKCVSSTIAGAVWAPFVPSAAGTVSTLTGNSGGPVGPDSSGDINVVGDGTTIRVVGNPGTHTLTASLVGGEVATQSYVTDIGGPVTPTPAGVIDLNASMSTYTDGATANTVKIELQGTDHALFVGRGNLNPAVTIPTGTLGQSLISGGSMADPAFNVLGVVGGGTGDTFFTPYSVITAGTINTGPLQNVVGVGTAGQVLTSNGAGSLPTWQLGGGSSTNVQVFTSSGTYTPTNGMVSCIVECIGGGGGGGGAADTTSSSNGAAGGGGGAGGYSRKTLSVSTIGASQSVTIGAGGSGGPAGPNNGTVGGTTSFGSLLNATGGGGGSGSIAFTNSGTPGGTGGSGSGGDFNTTGGGGFVGIIIGSSLSWAGVGGEVFFGGTPSGIVTHSGSASVIGPGGQSYGAGGCGACNAGGAAVSGGSGSSGIVIVTEFIGAGGGSISYPISVPLGGTSDISFTPYSVITGGATATGALQNVSSVGTTGQVLTSQGAGTLPSWQTPSIPAYTFVQDVGGGSITQSLVSLVGLPYQTYLLVVTAYFPATGPGSLVLNWSNDGGATYVTTGYDSGITFMPWNSISLTNINSTTAALLTNAQSSGQGACTGVYNLLGVNSGNLCAIAGTTTSGYLSNIGFVQAINNTSGGSYTAFKLTCTSGTFSISSALYGLNQ